MVGGSQPLAALLALMVGGDLTFDRTASTHGRRSIELTFDRTASTHGRR